MDLSFVTLSSWLRWSLAAGRWRVSVVEHANHPARTSRAW